MIPMVSFLLLSNALKKCSQCAVTKHVNMHPHLSLHAYSSQTTQLDCLHYMLLFVECLRLKYSSFHFILHEKKFFHSSFIYYKKKPDVLRIKECIL